MKKLLLFALIFVLLLSALPILTMAEGADGGADSVDSYKSLLYHGTEFPIQFDNAEFYDFYWYSEGVGAHENSFSSADGLTDFEYVYLKAYEGEDTSTAFPPEEACIYVNFDVDTAGVYDFLIEVMAFETYFPRTGLIQIDDGEKYYLTATHNTNHEVWEYFSGLSAYLTVGEHRMTVYLAPDFNDTDVKSLFFDNFYYMLDENAEVPDAPVETEPKEESTAGEDEQPTDTPSESVSGTEIDAETAAETQPETSAETPNETKAETKAETKPETQAEESGCASSLLALPGIASVMAAAWILRSKET